MADTTAIETTIPTGGALQKKLKEIRDRYALACEEWSPIIREGQTDIRYLKGDPWDERAREQREKAGRPCLSFDEMSQYVNQAVNDVRLNKRAARVTSKSSQAGGDADRRARVMAGLIRQIEYRSNAPQQAYTTMYENAVQRGYGWLRIKAQYVSDRSWDQELLIEEIPNPDMVVPDPDHQKADGADLEYLFFHEAHTVDEQRRQRKGALKGWTLESIAELAPTFVKGDKVVLCEYWVREPVERELVAIRWQGQVLSLFADEIRERGIRGHRVIRREVRQTHRVRMYLTNGVEILEATDWPGKYLPWVPCYGKVLFSTEQGRTERELVSLVRLARHPVKAYAFLRSTEFEIIGGVPRNSWVAYEGQLDGLEDEYIKANNEPVAVLYAKPRLEGVTAPGEILPLPQRQSWDPPLQNMEVVAESVRRAIQAAMGTSPLPTSAIRRNEKSGKALKQIEEAGQKGAFHFVDHYEASIRRAAEIAVDLMPHYYDTAREILIRRADDETELVRINDPTATDPKTGKRSPVVFDPDAEYDVTVGTGPSFDSEREAASEFADVLAGLPVFPQIADLVVRLKNLGPIGDEIADRLTPPQFRKPKDGQIDPMMLQQQLQHATQMIEALSKELEAKLDAEKTDKIKAQQTIEIEKIKAELQYALTQMENATKIRVAEIQASVKGYAIESDHAAAHEREAMGRVSQAFEAEAQRRHDVEMAERGHAQALEQGAQAAALRPAPEQQAGA